MKATGPTEEIQLEMSGTRYRRFRGKIKLMKQPAAIDSLF